MLRAVDRRVRIVSLIFILLLSGCYAFGEQLAPPTADEPEESFDRRTAEPALVDLGTPLALELVAEDAELDAITEDGHLVYRRWADAARDSFSLYTRSVETEEPVLLAPGLPVGTPVQVSGSVVGWWTRTTKKGWMVVGALNLWSAAGGLHRDVAEGSKNLTGSSDGTRVAFTRDAVEGEGADFVYTTMAALDAPPSLTGLEGCLAQIGSDDVLVATCKLASTDPDSDEGTLYHVSASGEVTAVLEHVEYSSDPDVHADGRWARAYVSSGQGALVSFPPELPRSIMVDDGVWFSVRGESVLFHSWRRGVVRLSLESGVDQVLFARRTCFAEANPDRSMLLMRTIEGDTPRTELLDVTATPPRARLVALHEEKLDHSSCGPYPFGFTGSGDFLFFVDGRGNLCTQPVQAGVVRCFSVGSRQTSWQPQVPDSDVILALEHKNPRLKSLWYVDARAGVFGRISPALTANRAWPHGGRVYFTAIERGRPMIRAARLP
jgi:hypothetical protein